MLRTLGLKRKEVRGGLRKLHNENVYNLYTPNIAKDEQIKGYEIDRACTTHMREARVKFWPVILKEITTLKT
jgi:hypothetical protein